MVFHSLRVGNNCVNTVSRTLVTLIDNMQKKSTRTYQEAIEALNRLQTNHQYIKDAAVKPKAETNIAEVKKFLERSGLSLDTLDQVPVIHVAGTNGKGTTCAYTESILRNHGYKTGFYSSPHLLDVRERIRINGLPISKTEFARHFWNIYDMLDRKKADNQDMPLYFRYLTILAFHVFFENKVDVAILEVGIGGEYDCTNVVRNTVVAGITPLDLDHTSLLGHSIESIAWNKAGIMKKKCVAFSTEQPEAAMNVLLERSLEKECSLTVVNYDYYKGGNNPRLPLHIQKTNASLALAISEAFIEKIVNDDHNSGKQFSLEIANKSIEATHWTGRYEIIDVGHSRFFLDGAHTIESMEICLKWFKEKTSNSNRNRVLIFNLTGERNPEVFFKQLSKAKFDIVIFVPNVGSDKDSADTVDHILPTDQQLRRCEAYSKKWSQMQSNGKTETIKLFPSFSRAVNFIQKHGMCDILVTGSIHLIGAALSVLNPTLNGTLKD